jgi:dienelactone hydrolase
LREKSRGPARPERMRVLRLAFLITLAVALIAIAPSGALAGWTKGTFQSDGKPVEEYHCTPADAGAHPAVILLHGLSLPGGGNQTFEQICTDLAAQGYFAEFIEFYSQTGQGTRTTDNRYYQIWLAEIRSGLDALDSNPGVDPRRVAMMGFSLGAFLSLTTGARNPGKLAAIVDYYGALPAPFHSGVRNLPPTLILHGAKDKLVPVARAYALDLMMTDAGMAHEIHIYPDAQHGFNFPEMQAWYNPADAHDAWNRTVAFLAKYLTAPSK